MSRPSIDHSFKQRKDSEFSGLAPPSLSQPHRRMSRMDGGGMGMNRRMSLFRRPSDTSYNSSLKAPVKLANTYRMEPNSQEKFNVAFVEKLLHGIMESFFLGEEYDPKATGARARNLSDVIKNRMKELHLPRYKFVCHVIIGQNNGQSLQTASRCLWNAAVDNFATATYKNSSLWAVANVYGCYFE